MKKIIRIISILSVWLFSTTQVFAQGIKNASGPLNGVAQKAGLSDKGNIGTLSGSIIAGALQLIGIIFLVLMVYAGILWMTARGKDDQIEKSRNIIIAALIGLFITVSAYAITVFVTANFV